MNYTYVDNAAGLDSMLECLSKAAVIAFDTEFFRVVTFFPKLALFQLAAGGEIFLVDPFAVNFSKLLSFIVTTDAVMVCHASGEDLEIVSEHARREGLPRLLPRHIFDTQSAGAFLGYGGNIGLAALLEKTLGISLAKTETRTDWLKRPLTQAQLEYAALDVAYLEELMNFLIKEMSQKEPVLKWFRMHMDDVSHSCDPENVLPPEKLYLRVRKTGQLSQGQLRTLQAVVMLRDRICRENDIPPAFFIRNNVLAQLVISSAIFEQSTYAKYGVHYSTVRKYGTLIQKTAREANARNEPDINPPYDFVNRCSGGIYKKRLSDFLARKTSQYGFANNVLSSQKLMENFFYAPMYEKKYPILQRGWYLECLGDLSDFYLPEAQKYYKAGELKF